MMDKKSAWEAQTEELLNRTEQKMRELQEEAERIMSPYLDRKAGLIAALEAYRDLMGVTATETAKPLTDDDVQGKSQIGIMKLIAVRNGNLLVVRTAIKLMKQAGIFGNPDNAPAMVYSILSRSKDFHRVGRGIYKLNGVYKHKAKSSVTKVRKPRLPGLNEAIKNLIANTPQVTKNEVVDILIKGGFNFQDRNPNKSVNRAWLNIKSKEPKQKPMELVT